MTAACLFGSSTLETAITFFFILPVGYNSTVTRSAARISRARFAMSAATCPRNRCLCTCSCVPHQLAAGSAILFHQAQVPLGQRPLHASDHPLPENSDTFDAANAHSPPPPPGSATAISSTKATFPCSRIGTNNNSHGEGFAGTSTPLPLPPADSAAWARLNPARTHFMFRKKRRHHQAASPRAHRRTPAVTPLIGIAPGMSILAAPPLRQQLQRRQIMLQYQLRPIRPPPPPAARHSVTQTSAPPACKS